MLFVLMFVCNPAFSKESTDSHSGERHPLRGTINIPKVTITDDYINGIVDSIMDITINGYKISKDYNFYLQYYVEEKQSRYKNVYSCHLVVWAEPTNDIPWSDYWKSYSEINGYTCFHSKDLTIYATDGEKSAYRTFDYNCEEERKTHTPVYEWEYYSYDGSSRLHFKRHCIRNRSQSCINNQDYEEINKIWDRLTNQGCDPWGK